jgi:putative membrane protein
MHMMWGSWGIGMMLMMLVFWGALIVGIIVLSRWFITSGQGGGALDTVPHRESALDILQKRYARGELSKAEFEAMRQDLQEHV